MNSKFGKTEEVYQSWPAVFQSITLVVTSENYR